MTILISYQLETIDSNYMQSVLLTLQLRTFRSIRNVKFVIRRPCNNILSLNVQCVCVAQRVDQMQGYVTLT